jgi:hypothetical protein
LQFADAISTAAQGSVALRGVEKFDRAREAEGPSASEVFTMEKKRKIELMLQEILSRGGLVHLSDNLTDEQREFFLEEILSCPDCIEEAERIAGVSARRAKDH